MGTVETDGSFVIEHMNALPATGWRRVAEAALGTLSPPRCAGCGWFSPHLFCEACAPRVRWADRGGRLCERCGERFDPLAVVAPGALCARCRDEKQKPPLERVRSLWLLRGPVRAAVHSFKYLRHTAPAASLGAHMAALARRDPVLSEASAVVAVPLHGWREWARGFNQSDLLARHVAAGLGVPCADLLARVRHTPTQTALSRAQREGNVRAAFAARPQVLAAHAKYLREAGMVLLVDDVWTTGATLRECARTLRAAGIDRVCALTLARR